MTAAGTGKARVPRQRKRRGEVAPMPRVLGCGERRAHEAHLYETPQQRFRCPGIEPVSDELRELAATMRHRGMRYERRLILALTKDAG